MAFLLATVIIVYLTTCIILEYLRPWRGYRLRGSFWDIFSPQMWREVLEDNIRCAVAPFRVVDMDTVPNLLPPYTFLGEQCRYPPIYCWHEDEAILLRLTCGGRIERLKFWSELLNDRGDGNTAR